MDGVSTVAKVTTTVVKSAVMVVNLFGLANTVSKLITHTNDSEPHNSDHFSTCADDTSAAMPYVLLVSTIAIGGLLLHTKYAQMAARHPQRQSVMQELETAALLQSTDDAVPEDVSRVKKMWLTAGSFIFIVADSFLNAGPYLEMTPWEAANYSLAAVGLALFITQNVGYTHRVNSGQNYKFYKTPVAGVLDKAAVGFRTAAAKYSLIKLIMHIDFPDNVSWLGVIASIAVAMEPTVLAAKWSNYQSLEPLEEGIEREGHKFLTGWLTGAYSGPDGALYGYALAKHPTVYRYIFQCDDDAVIITAAAIIAVEAMGYVKKFKELADSKEIDGLRDTLQKCDPRRACQ